MDLVDGNKEFTGSWFRDAETVVKMLKETEIVERRYIS